MAAADDPYDLSIYARGSVTEDDEASTGLHPNRQPAPTLRVFPDTQRREYAEGILYGSIDAFQQDAGWFELSFRGKITHQGKKTFGDWVMRVEGQGIESIRQQVARHIRTILRVGKSPDGSAIVTRIAFRPDEFEVLE